MLLYGTPNGIKSNRVRSQATGLHFRDHKLLGWSTSSVSSFIWSMLCKGNMQINVLLPQSSVVHFPS